MNDADRAALAEQYADADNLDARIQLHETYDTADRDWWRWVFDHYERLSDFSAGMADDARATLAEAGVDAGVSVAAAEAFPLPDDSVDAVVANHMLYHVARTR